jgi:hypothetical protein
MHEAEQMRGTYQIMRILKTSARFKEEAECRYSDNSADCLELYYLDNFNPETWQEFRDPFAV